MKRPGSVGLMDQIEETRDLTVVLAPSKRSRFGFAKARARIASAGCAGRWSTIETVVEVGHRRSEELLYLRARIGFKTTDDSGRAERTHFEPPESAQTHVFIGFSGKLTPSGAARNYHNMKILADQGRDV